MFTSEERHLVEQQIRSLCTLGLAREFLRDRDLPRSGSSWDDLFEKRIWPSYDDGDLSDSDLLRLLAQGEEYGGQHIFLFRPRRSRTANVRRALQEDVVEEAIEQLAVELPLVLDRPTQPTIGDVRLERPDGRPLLTIKEVSRRRVFNEKVEKEYNDGSQLVLRQVEHVRLVNVARLNWRGELEIRLAKINTRGRYDGELKAFWKRLELFLDANDFAEVALVRVKDHLYERRHELAGEIRHVKTRLADDSGVTLEAAADRTYESGVANHSGADAAMATFSEGDDGTYCDAQNVYFLEQENQHPARDVHVILKGEANQFAIPGKCSASDYEHVLGRIRSIARSSS